MDMTTDEIQTFIEEAGTCIGHVLLVLDGARGVLFGPERSDAARAVVKGVRGVPRHGLAAARIFRKAIARKGES